ncbi:MAG: flavin reductase family protein [Gammaproteobacteria bacterium]|nr:flavin reductase family protein [Gammaproteobacteria bacterium]
MDNQVFKKAMSRFPSGVVIVTTISSSGKKHGFTASAFSSLSLDPPLILVCLANTADCFEPFVTCDKFAVNVIGHQQHELAFKFATKGVDKFDGGEFDDGKSGLPIISNSIFTLECNIKDTYPGGDHEILVGEVQHATVNEGTPSIWYEGNFRDINC